VQPHGGRRTVGPRLVSRAERGGSDSCGRRTWTRGLTRPRGSRTRHLCELCRCRAPARPACHQSVRDRVPDARAASCTPGKRIAHPFVTAASDPGPVVQYRRARNEEWYRRYRLRRSRRLIVLRVLGPRDLSRPYPLRTAVAPGDGPCPCCAAGIPHSRAYHARHRPAPTAISSTATWWRWW
jgi:hypothetical protein